MRRKSCCFPDGGGNGSSSESDLIGRIADIENLDGYEYIGVGSTDRSVSSRYRSSDSYSSVLVGYTDGRVEELTYLDSSGRRISGGIYLGDLKRLGDYIFLSLHDGASTSGYNFCIHVPGNKLYRLPKLDIEFKGNTDHSVSMDGSVVTFTASDSIYELSAEKGMLNVNELIDLTDYPDFRSFFRDRYGNIYSTLDNQQSYTVVGCMWTPSDKTYHEIELLPDCPRYTYRLSINGITYIEYLDEDNQQKKGFFDENGDIQEIPEGGFYPFGGDYISGNMGEAERDQFRYFTYQNGNTLYWMMVQYGRGVYPMIQSNVREIKFEDKERIAFTERGPVIDLIPTINEEGIRTISMAGPIMYILTNKAFYSIDFPSRNAKVLSNKYFPYKNFWDLGPIGFELQVLDENGNTLSVLINKEGKEIQKEISDYCKYDHFSLSPLN